MATEEPTRLQDDYDEECIEAARRLLDATAAAMPGYTHAENATVLDEAILWLREVYAGHDAAKETYDQQTN